MPVRVELVCTNAPTHTNSKNDGSRNNVYLAYLL